MPEEPGDYTSVPIDRLLAFGEAVLTRLEVPERDARLTASILLDADLRGVESHGMAHLVDFYVRRLQQGLINPRPDITVARQTASAATLEADRALGFVAGHQAMSLAIEKARATGAGWVSVANSTHYGAGAYYAMMALEHSMIGLSMTTGGRLLAAPGTKDRALGLNVLAVAAPTGREFPYVLDMASSVVAFGKVEIARRRGTQIPQGWAIDGEGRPVTDPAQVAALLPLGGAPETGAYKGFGLSILVDILCGALSGFGTSAEIEGGRTAAHCFGALRIDAFGSDEAYRERMGALIDAVHRAEPVAGGAPALVPGELEDRLARERRAAGAVPLHPAILEGFAAAAEELGVGYDLA